MSKDRDFSLKCGTIKLPGSICKKCTPILSKADNRSASMNNGDTKTSMSTKNQKKQNLERKKNINTTHAMFQPHRRPRTVARYSLERGLEIDWDLNTPESENVKAVYCIRCGKLKAKWEGIWIIPGGLGDLDPEVKAKRVFLCGQCWSPARREMRLGDYFDSDDGNVYNPL